MLSRTFSTWICLKFTVSEKFINKFQSIVITYCKAFAGDLKIRNFMVKYVPEMKIWQCLENQLIFAQLKSNQFLDTIIQPPFYLLLIIYSSLSLFSAEKMTWQKQNKNKLKAEQTGSAWVLLQRIWQGIKFLLFEKRLEKRKIRENDRCYKMWSLWSSSNSGLWRLWWHFLLQQRMSKITLEKRTQIFLQSLQNRDSSRTGTVYTLGQ